MSDLAARLRRATYPDWNPRFRDAAQRALNNLYSRRLEIMGESDLTYEVSGADIIARMEERAGLADAVVEDMSGHDAQNPCNAGIINQAKEDSRSLRLRAKYLDEERTYTLGPGTLQEIFLTQPHYAEQIARGLRADPGEAMTERSW